MLPTMSLLRVAPKIDVHSDQIRGCTAWAAQLLVLFAYARYVTIDRRRRRVTVSIRLLWLDDVTFSSHIRGGGLDLIQWKLPSDHEPDLSEATYVKRYTGSAGSAASR
jgi:hypothetical protein